MGFRHSGISYLIFVDLSKAYDTEPHEALFAKKDHIGIRGRTLDFIKALYASSEISVKLDGYLSKPFKLLRGLRQGCPLSPILFDIFDNDWLGQPGVIRLHIGVTVPGIHFAREGLMAGLLFADDLVGMASSLEDARFLAEVISDWCTRWEMEVGIKKCGVMCVGGKDIKVDMDSLQMKLREEPPLLMGMPIPVVEEYVYLGLVIDRMVDLGTMAAGRVKKAEMAYRKIQPFLVDQHIPIATRIMVLKAVVGSTLLYGSEVWGMSKSRCKKGQTLMNKAIRILMMVKEKDDTIRVTATWREMGIPPVHAEAAARRARALIKFPSLKTWVSTLAIYPFSCRRGGWFGDSKKWMVGKAQGALEKLRAHDDSGEGVYHKSKVAYDEVLMKVWESMEEADQKVSGFYEYWGFKGTSWTASSSVPSSAREEQARLGRGLRSLHLCRVKGFKTARRMVKACILGKEHMDVCPCCGQAGGETIGHMLLKCERWRKQRSSHMGGLIREAYRVFREMLPTGGVLTVEGDQLIVVLMLGGECHGRRIELWGPDTSHPMGCGAFQIARFLQSIEIERSKVLRELSLNHEVPLPQIDAPRVRQQRASLGRFN
jgi:hypothetical protein